MQLLRIVAAGLTAMALCAAPAAAHRVHAGVTEIAVNPRTGEMEVIHRLFTHDLLDALETDIRNERDAAAWLATGAGLEAVGSYAGEHFRMADAGGAVFELDYVGAEVDGEFAWIYFAAEPPPAQDAFIVDNALLADRFDDQVMMTNLRFGDTVRTAMQGPGRRAPVRVRFD